MADPDLKQRVVPLINKFLQYVIVCGRILVRDIRKYGAHIYYKQSLKIGDQWKVVCELC